MNITLECIAHNNPMLIVEDRQRVAVEISKKYNTYCLPYAVNLYFKTERWNSETKLIVDSTIPSSEEQIVVHSVGRFVEYITENGLPEEISFGITLLNDRTTLSCIKWVLLYCEKQEFILDSKLNIHNSDKNFHKEFIEILTQKDIDCRLTFLPLD